MGAQRLDHLADVAISRQFRRAVGLAGGRQPALEAEEDVLELEPEKLPLSGPVLPFLP